MTSGLNPLIKEITDFEQLQAFVSEHEGNLIDLSKTYYCSLGTDLGFDTYAPYSVSKGTALFELDVVWLTAQNIEVAFEFEFGNIEEFLSALAKLILCEPELSVVFVSSRSHAINFETASELAQNIAKFKKNLLIVDISDETYELI
ncbi:MAG: hypothetical protein QXM75_03075 [Candidatus Diapherotrites archaeon]